MIAQPKVSIITCFLNVASFLQAAVESVLRQEYTNWELLLIDDGSTDGSTAIAQAYAQQHPQKIFYLAHPNHENKGSSASRNLGMEQSTGDLIAFLDADDVYLPQYLATQVALLQQQQVTMVCEATLYWYSWKDKAQQDVLIPVGAPASHRYAPPELALRLYPLGKGAAPCICGMIVKKEAFKKYGGFDASFTGMYDEQVPLAKLYLHEPVYISAVCNNHYRQRPDSLVGISSRDQKAYLAVRKQFLEWMEGYLQQKGYQDKRVWKLLRKGLLPYRWPVYYFFTHHLPHSGPIIRQNARRVAKKVLPTPMRQFLNKTLFGQN